MRRAIIIVGVLVLGVGGLVVVALMTSGSLGVQNVGGPVLVYVKGNIPTHGFAGVDFDRNAPSGRVVVHTLVHGGPADTAGVRKGDVITGVDGVSVMAPDDVKKTLAAKRPGDVVRVAIERDGQQLVLNLTLIGFEEVSRLNRHNDP